MEQITIEEYKKRLKKGNKYGAKPCVYNGRKYHSTGEMEYAIKLDWIKKGGEIIEIIPQYPIKIIVDSVFICDYDIDFKVIYKDGHVEYHEFKGFETDLWRIKWKLVHALYPNLKFVLIKKPF